MTTTPVDSTRLVEERRGRVLLLRMESVCGRNPVSPTLSASIRDALTRASADSGIGAIILTGSNGVFSAGGDVRKLLTAFDEPRDVAVLQTLLAEAAATAVALSDSEKPTIAVVNGAAAGGGLALALACDIRIAAASAKFAYAYPHIALAGDFAINWNLMRVLGPARAGHFCLSGRTLDSAAALRIGLVGEVIADDLLEAEAMVLATDIASMPPQAIVRVKANLDICETASRTQAILLESENFVIASRSAEHRNALEGFVERRRQPGGKV